MQSQHTFATQRNEGFNNKVSRYAPKSKVYSRTMSLNNRVAIAVGLQNMGHAAFWRTVFGKLGMPMPPRTAEYLHEKDKRMRKQKARANLPENKIKRSMAKIQAIYEENQKEMQSAK